MISKIPDWVWCLFTSHKYEADRAEDYEEGGYTRHHGDGTQEPIPACYVVEKCSRCGTEQRIYSSVSIAEQFDVPKEWEDNE